MTPQEDISNYSNEKELHEDQFGQGSVTNNKPKTVRVKKLLVFDLDTKVCRLILGNNYRRVYYQIIRPFLERRGFEHVQGSGYISINPMTNLQVTYCIRDLLRLYPYLSKCIRDIRVGDIKQLHRLNNLCAYDGTPGIYRGMYQKSTGRQIK